MDTLGNPERAVPAIHVTGTNGKGTTATLTAEILREVGLCVGLYTSPHIHALNERIAIDGSPIDEATLDAALTKVHASARRVELDPTWFEAMTAAAFVAFAAAEVDAMVIEVGMLGRWDATNVIDAAVSVVTNVGTDHLDAAGPTREHVAREKAGIVHPGATLILGEVDKVLLPIFLGRLPAHVWALGREILVEQFDEDGPGSTAYIRTPFGDRSNVELRLRGRHQAANAGVAVAAAEAFTGGALSDNAVRVALARTALAGRCEFVAEAPAVIVDGAHNVEAAHALRKVVDQHGRIDGRRVLVVAALAGRDFAAFAEALGVRDFDAVVVTEVPNARSVPAAELAETLERAGVTCMHESDPLVALDLALDLATSDGLVLATGSLYLVDPVRTHLDPQDGGAVTRS